MDKRRILLVEDDENIAELVRYNLTRHGFMVSCLSSGEEVLASARGDPPELILLDIMLPGMDGLDVLRRLRDEESTRAIPIVMLTARSEESDIVSGLELGADDYIVKPFSPRVLLARVRAVLRRDGRQETQAGAAEEAPLDVHGLRIDSARHRVTSGDRPIDLTVTEFRILHLLAGRPGRVFTRSQIVEAVRGEDYYVTDRAVDVAIFGLRRKLEEAAGLIETVRGIGYRFRD